MTHQWDDFSKSLAQDSVPRRQSLRLLGAAIAGAIFSPLRPEAAWAGVDPCKAFCRCANKREQNACLAACRNCSSSGERLCGSCGNGYVCTDVFNDVFNCGACNFVCEAPGPFEDGACLGGECVYACVEGALDCDGACTPVLYDRNNCGACGNVCGAATPYCEQGTCTDQAPCPAGLTRCNGACYDLYNDSGNCGTSCANRTVCGLYETCTGGVCVPVD